MPNPPKMARYTIEAVLCLMNGLTKTPDWNECKKSLREDGFIQRVMSFDKDSVKPSVRKMILTKYLNDNDWNIDAIFRASKAAGPLAKWVQSLIEYVDIFERITPLRDEVQSL